MDIALPGLIELVKEYGPIVFACFIIYGLLKRLIVPLETYLELKSERDWWRKFALSLLDLSEQSVNVADTIAKKKPKRGGGTADADE